MPKGKYEKWLKPENISLLRGWKSDGLTNEQIAKNMDINPDTLYVWISKYPEIATALSRGREQSDYVVQNELFESARNRVVELKTPFKVKRVRYADGKKVGEEEELVYGVREEYVPGNVNAQMYWMRNRRPDLWADGKDIGGDSTTPNGRLGPVYIPATKIAPSFVGLNRLIDGRKFNEYTLKGGRGSTKSSFVGMKIPELIINNPNMHACVVRKVGNTLRDSVYSQIKWGIYELGLEAQFNFTISPMEITYIPTGQKIYFRGADDPAKIKSIKPTFGYIGILWFEELDQFNGDEEIRNITQSVIRGTDENGESRCYIFKSFNPPKSAKNWANQYVLVSKPTMYVHHSTYLDVPEEWLGDVFLSEAENLKTFNYTAYRNEYLGEVTGEGGIIFENVREQTITDEMINTFGYCRRGLDWGFAVDPFAYVEDYYDARNKTLYIFNEIYGARMSFDRVDEELKRANPMKLAIRADSAEPRSNNEMTSRGHCIVPAKKGPGSPEHGIKWMQGLRAIVIDPKRCPHTFGEFTGYEYERTKTGEFYSAYPDKDNHAIDAVRYSLEDIILMGA